MQAPYLTTRLYASLARRPPGHLSPTFSLFIARRSLTDLSSPQSTRDTAAERRVAEREAIRARLRANRASVDRIPAPRPARYSYEPPLKANEAETDLLDRPTRKAKSFFTEIVPPLAFVLWIAIITFELIEGQWQLWTHEKEQPIMLAQMNALEKELEARSKTLKAR